MHSVTITPNSRVTYLDLVTIFGLPVFLGALIVKTKSTSVMPFHHSNNQLMKQEGPVLVKTTIAEPYNNVNQFWQDFSPCYTKLT